VASFRGHLYGGAAVSAAAALGVDSLRWAPLDQIPTLFILGLLGGLLPDIDSDGSTPVRVLFTLLGMAAAFLASFSSEGNLTSLESLSLGGAVFLLVRFGLFEVFCRLTVHRGVWHSWLAALFVALATTNTFYHFVGFSIWESWLAGIFVALGYLTHLCLDEIASVDLLGNRVKRSFGTALKPFSITSPAASLAMFLGVILLAYLAPTVQPVLAAASRFHPGQAIFPLL